MNGLPIGRRDVMEALHMGILTLILLLLLIYVFCKVTYVALKLLAIVLIIVCIVQFGEKLLGL